MLLAIDAGNTSITAGCLEGGSLLCRAQFSAERRTADELAVLMGQALRMRGVDTAAFEGAVMSCVVPPLLEMLRGAVRLVTGHDPLVVGAGVKTGLNIGIDDPSTLGADLVASAVAALDGRTPPVIIADLSTATTIFVIDGKSRLLGGAIMPGAAVSLDALAGTASLLPSIPFEAPKRCIGTNTNDCMKSGAVFGTASAIDGMIDRFEAELGERAALVATGYLARRIIPYCQHDLELDDDLTMKGLAMIWERNKKARKK